MGGYKPVPLDAPPLPQMQPTEVRPAPMQPPPQPLPTEAGYSGKTGAITNVAANFLQGWMKGKQQAEAKKLQMANQNVEGAHYAFQIAQSNAAQIANDSKATPDQKQQAEQARQAAWKSYLDITEQYTTPEKKTGGKKQGGVKGAASGIGEHMKQMFGAEDPHIFSQATLAFLRTSGPPPIPEKDPQQKLAELQYAHEKNIYSAVDKLADARSKGAPPEEIAKLEQNVRDVQGQIQSPKEKLDNSLAEATQSYMAGKPINDQTKKVLEAGGYIPKPILPNIFMQSDAKNGKTYIVAVNPETGKQIGDKQDTGIRGAVQLDARQEAFAVYKAQVDMLRDELKKAHEGDPEWDAKRIEKTIGDAMLSGTFKVKQAPGLTIAKSQEGVSRAIGDVVGTLDPDERKLFGEVTTRMPGVGGGGFAFKSDYESTFNTLLPWRTSNKDLRDFDNSLRSRVRQRLEQYGWTPEQIDTMVPATVEDARGRGIEPTPGGAGGGGGGGKQIANKADVEAFAKQNNMTYDQAVKAVQEQGFEVK